MLLKNEEKLLPLDAAKLKKVAIIGGSAKAYVLSGGGVSIAEAFILRLAIRRNHKRLGQER